MKHKVQETRLSTGNVVLIKKQERNRRKWKIDIVDELYYGRNDVISAVKLRSEKSFIKRPIQHLYRSKLNCDIKQTQERKIIKRGSSLFGPTRTAAAVV